MLLCVLHGQDICEKIWRYFGILETALLISSKSLEDGTFVIVCGSLNMDRLHRSCRVTLGMRLSPLVHKSLVHKSQNFTLVRYFFEICIYSQCQTWGCKWKCTGLVQDARIPHICNVYAQICTNHCKYKQIHNNKIDTHIYTQSKMKKALS